MPSKNTLNVCIGHLPFPQTHSHHIDLMITPRSLAVEAEIVVVDDSIFGQHGSALSEYVQLLWLLEHIDTLAAGCSYVRIFQYRRFVSRDPPTVGRRPVNMPWSTTITPGDLNAFPDDFDRIVNIELFNCPVQYQNGMLGQYASAHILEDILNFTKFLTETGVLTGITAAEFLRENVGIPACNIGIFKLQTYCSIFSVLLQGAEFVNSPYFVARTGYQRRSVGFLLERLHSHLILTAIRQGQLKANFGHNIIISNDVFVSSTE